MCIRKKVKDLFRYEIGEIMTSTALCSRPHQTFDLTVSKASYVRIRLELFPKAGYWAGRLGRSHSPNLATYNSRTFSVGAMCSLLNAMANCACFFSYFQIIHRQKFYIPRRISILKKGYLTKLFKEPFTLLLQNCL